MAKKAAHLESAFVEGLLFIGSLTEEETTASGFSLEVIAKLPL
ncbi:hypothetical protein [Marinomonas primoryensis]|nr:hypothetical protein [Marinomonas primoryensis]